MIIKRQQAETLKAPSPPPAPTEYMGGVSSAGVVGVTATVPEPEPEPEDPYTTVDLSAEVFDQGILPDRRRGERAERRAGFRRLEDQALISQAHEEANAIREAAAEEGLQQGLAQAQSTVDDLMLAIQELMIAREQAIESVTYELGSMAVDIAERILATEVSCDETVVLNLVRQTLAKVGRDQKSLTIKVHPTDLDLVKTEMKRDTGLSQSVEVLVDPDDSVEPGSCIVESRAGQIDARFSTQLEIIRQMIKQRGID